MFVDALNGIDRIQYIEPVGDCVLEVIPETLENAYFSKRTISPGFSPEQNWNYKAEKKQFSSQKFAILESKFTPSPVDRRQIRSRNFDTTDKKKLSDQSESYAFAQQDRDPSDSISMATCAINLEPQYDSQTPVGLNLSTRIGSMANDSLLSRNIEFAISESIHLDQVEDLKDARTSAKLLIGQSILNMKGSFNRDSITTAGGSFSSPFASLDTSKDLKKLQKSLADLQRDGRTKSSYCNPCTLI